jgi:hypothetical protein
MNDNDVYLFYKHKVIRWIPNVSIDKGCEFIKASVDAGNFNTLPDTPFLNEEMEKYPDDVHVFGKQEKIIPLNNEKSL